jgi:tetratricopeptide (TPR) repeat protein
VARKTSLFVHRDLYYHVLGSRMAREHVAAANALGRAGKHDEAAATLRVALAQAELRGAERAHVLGHLASELRLAVRLDEAIATARDAVTTAVTAADPHARAYAQFALGTALISAFERDGDPALLSDAMEALDGAAEGYQQLGHIDFSSVLLTMAEAFRMIGEHEAARGVLVRVTRELADARWAAPEANARHAGHVRGRAYLGLGAIALATDHRDEAVRMFDEASQLLIASADISAAPLLEDIATVMETELDDPAAAEQIRTAARTLPA